MSSIRNILLIVLSVSGVATNVMAEDIVNQYLRGAVQNTFYDPSPRPGFDGGTLYIRAKFVNKSDLKITSLAFRVLGITGGNRLTSVDNEENGYLASKLTLPIGLGSSYENGILSPGERVNPWFIIALKSKQQFQFYVDAVGIAASTPDVAFLEKGMNFKTVVDSFPGDTTFIIRKGEHRKQSVIPKEGNIFIGEDGARMNGSVLMSEKPEEWNRDGQCWSAKHVPLTGNWVHPNNPDFCQQDENGTTCKYPEDLYLNNILVRQIESKSELGLFDSDIDLWWLDYANKKAHLCMGKTGGNPWDNLIEISYARFAFGGGDQGSIDDPTFKAKSSVEVRDLILEKYAGFLQTGAVGYQKAGDEWLVKNNETRLNHAGGISFSNNSQVIGNYSHDNGEIGIKTGVETSKAEWPFTGSNVTQNVIEKNGRPDLGYIVDWEGGGTKFSHTRGLLVDRNWVINNGGPGLWTDINNCDVSYLCNVVEDNRDEGIYHEISYSASIVDNIVRGNGSNIDRVYSNGKDSETPTWAAQISISTSSDTQVAHNFVETDDVVGNGITLYQASREGEPKDYCTGEQHYCTKNNRVFQNMVVHHKRVDESKNTNAGITGGDLVWSDSNCDQESFLTTNDFDANAFYTPKGDPRTEKYWYWNNQKTNFNTFVATFNDHTSTLDTIESIAIDDDLTVIPDPGCFNTIGELGVPRDFLICLVTPDSMNFVTTQLDGEVRGTGDLCESRNSVRIYDVNGGELVDGDVVYIQAPSSLYWAADEAGNLKADSKGVNAYEQFQIHKVRGTGGSGSIISDYDKVGLRSVPYDKWIVAEDGGGSILRVNRPERKEWETFTLITKR